MESAPDDNQIDEEILEVTGGKKALKWWDSNISKSKILWDSIKDKNEYLSVSQLAKLADPELMECLLKFWSLKKPVISGILSLDNDRDLWWLETDKDLHYPIAGLK